MNRSKVRSLLKKRRSYLLSDRVDITLTSEQTRANYQNKSLTIFNKIADFDKDQKTDRYFKVVWRVALVENPKTWKGHGSLKVKPLTQNAILSDDTGEVLAEGIIPNLNQLKFDNTIILKDKEFELLAEITADRKLILSTKHKNLIPQNINSCKRQKILPEVQNIETNCLSNDLNKISNMYLDEIVICVRSTELQQELIDEVYVYYERQKNLPLFNLTQNVIDVLHHICTHPSLLNTKTFQENNILCKILSKELPPSQEMGTFDSAKLEFLQLLLDHQQLWRSQNYMMMFMAKHTASISMLKELCRFMNVPYVLINDFSQQYLDYWIYEQHYSPSAPLTVALMQIYQNDKEEQLQYNLLHSIITKYSFKFQQIFLFEEVIAIRQELIKITSTYESSIILPIQIRILITSFTIEEVQLWHLEKNLLRPLDKDYLDKVFKDWKDQKIEYDSDKWNRIPQMENSKNGNCSIENYLYISCSSNLHDENMVETIYIPANRNVLIQNTYTT